MIKSVWKNIVEISKLPAFRLLLIVLMSVIVGQIILIVYGARIIQDNDKIARNNRGRTDSLFFVLNKRLLDCQREKETYLRKYNEETKKAVEEWKDLYLQTDENYQETKRLKKETQKIKDKL